VSLNDRGVSFDGPEVATGAVPTRFRAPAAPNRGRTRGG
jgi:hypothetical protein